jgi:CubicO group peptidase (beta-lactamase class C family)
VSSPRADAAALDVSGTTAPGWEPLRDAFARNLTDGLETGAAVAVYHHGRPVVDLWGGVADRRTGRPWQRDTVACVFSTTKGVTAIAAHLLVQRGQLDLDAPVARYWPEFAQAGKEDVPVRWLLTHQVGLQYVDDDLTLDDLRALTPVVDALAAQRPDWGPGKAFGYHAVTFGHLVGEVVRRVSGRPLAAFLAEELFAPLGANAVLALPEDAVIDLAHLDAAPEPPDPVEVFGEAAIPFIERFRRSISLGSALPARLVTDEPGDFNDRRVLAAELGGSGLVSDARSLARVYAATVSEVDGVRLLTDQTAAACIPLQTVDVPPIGMPAPATDGSGFALGFIADGRIGPTSFGHPGAGGSVAFADLDARLSFAYVMNRMGGEPDLRASSLIEATRLCLR